ncbi:putative paraoxonase [Xylariales sp. AK1849]|nr:putative paraoxonase [Xylariales sp. AK1849]
MLWLIYSNTPERLPRINAFDSHEIKFADRIKSCEDVLLVESAGLAILACDPGRERWNSVMGFFLPGPVASGELYLYDYKDPGAADAECLKRLELVDYEPGKDFHSLGLAFDEDSSLLFVANHRHDGPRVDVFKLALDSLKAHHVRSIQHHLIHGPNSIVLVNSNELYVTNDHHFLIKDHRFLAQLETYSTLPGGSVVHVNISDPNAVNADVVARVPFANGIEMLNQTILAVASTNMREVLFYSVTNAGTPDPTLTLAYQFKVKVPFNVDNLSLSPDGRLLMAGHAHFPTTFKFAKTRYICNDPAEFARADAATKEYCKTGQATSWVSEWTETGGLKHLYVDTEYPTSATATRDAKRKVGIIAGLYAKGLLVWRE